MKVFMNVYATSFKVGFAFRNDTERAFFIDACRKFHERNVTPRLCIDEISDLNITIFGELMNEKHIDFIEYLIQCIDLRQQRIERLQKLINNL